MILWYGLMFPYLYLDDTFMLLANRPLDSFSHSTAHIGNQSVIDLTRECKNLGNTEVSLDYSM